VCCTAGNWVTPALPVTAEVLSNKTLTNPAGTTQTLADAATIAWDASLGQIGSVTPTANRTFGAPTNLKSGGRYTLSITQDGTGGRTHTFNAVFKCSNGQAFPQPTSAAAAVTVYDLVSPDGTNLYLNTSSLPAGVILSHGSSSLPAGFLGCDGAAVSRTTYAALFAVISTTWGAGDASTTFNVPNFQRRVAVGSGGSGTATLANSVGSTGGEETHVLTTAELAAHTHTLANATALTGATTNVTGGATGTSITATGSAGSDTAHNNIQPSAVVLKIIKY
jgi:microcystin-dependent protein